MVPASSVSGWHFNHPESKYFATGKLAKDQIEDPAQRPADEPRPSPDAHGFGGSIRGECSSATCQPPRACFRSSAR